MHASTGPQSSPLQREHSLIYANCLLCSDDQPEMQDLPPLLHTTISNRPPIDRVGPQESGSGIDRNKSVLI